MFRITIILLIISAAISFPQNVELLSHLNQYPSIGYNDIWGYTDGQGIEYALLGTQHGTSIVRIDNPTNPQEVAFIPGPVSIWRDIKVHSTYAYTVTEQTGSGQGLQIIDLSQLPTSATLANTVDTWFNHAHNLFIDNGFAYVVGTNNGGGMHILDLSDPINPTQTAYYQGSGYIHDIYVWNDTVVACTGDQAGGGRYDLVDVTNKSNPQLISQSAGIFGIYAHSGWMTEDKRYFLACEEFNSRDILVYDLLDRNNWNLVVPTWQLPTGSSIIHNLFVRGNYAHISYYTSGYVVLDVSDPTNLQVVGQYDTYPLSDGGTYNGAWGCYPYFPSGNTIISDIETGLYVLRFAGTVPVELTSFTAATSAGIVTLNWSTSTEINNHGFEIQRKSLDESGENNEFITIGFIEGSGTTTEPHQYNFSDNYPAEGKNQYRLKQVDFNGKVEYSDIVEIDVITISTIQLKQNYPNPFNPITQIQFSIANPGFVNLSVFNSIGEKVEELVNKSLPKGNYTVNFDAASLPSGIYIARLTAGNFTRSIKMSLLK